MPAACFVQEVILSERRFQYEAEVSANPMNYDAWFDYVRLEEAAGSPDKVQMLLGVKVAESASVTFIAWLCWTRPAMPCSSKAGGSADAMAGENTLLTASRLWSDAEHAGPLPPAWAGTCLCL